MNVFSDLIPLASGLLLNVERVLVPSYVVTMFSRRATVSISQSNCYDWGKSVPDSPVFRYSR